MIARLRIDRGTLRAAGFVTLLTLVFLVTNTVVAAAAQTDPGGPGAGLLGPLNILTREGAPLSGYLLESEVRDPNLPSAGVPLGVSLAIQGPPDIDVSGYVQRMVMSGLFTLVRLLVGLCCWLIGFVFKFPLLTLLTGPAQRLADAYQRHVVGALGLQGLLLGWAFIFGLILFVRGKVGTGLGEIVMTLVIAALAASAFIRPDYLLGRDGPLGQAHQAAIEVASITTSSYFDGATQSGRPCESVAGPDQSICAADAKTVTDPIQAALTDALVVKPYMLLQYGRVLDPNNPDDAAAYQAHLNWVKSKTQKPGAVSVKHPDADTSKCDGILGDYVKEACRKSIRGEFDPCATFKGDAKEYCRLGDGSNEVPFSRLIKDLEKAGPVGKACAAYARQPSWDRVWSVIALLVAVVVVTLMVVSMAVVMLGAQGADAAAAAGGPVAWVWAMLPGPSRMLLWRWIGVFVVSALVSFMAAMALPFFGIAVDALLSDAGPDQMVERLLLIDAFAVAFLIMHRRILAATAGFGSRISTRMRFAKIGGSHLSGDNSEFGAALAVHGPGHNAGSSGFMARGLSPAHSAFGARLRSLGSLSALTDPAGMPFAPGRLIGDALAEGRRGIAPLALALRGAHSLLVGPPPVRHPAAAALHQVASGRPDPAGEIQVDKQTGQVLHDPATDRPLLGSRIHQRASRLRGYRIAHRTAAVAYRSTFGLPRTLHAAKKTTSEFTEDVLTQFRVTRNHLGDDAFAWAQGGRAVRDRLEGTGQGRATARQANDPAGTVRDGAVAAAIHTAPVTAASRASRPATTHSAPRTPGSGPRGPVPPAGPGAAAPPAAPSRITRPVPPPDPSGAPGTPGTGSGSRSASSPDPVAAAEANAARLRAVFEARRAAQRRLREGDE